jgi:hypothetical protein
MTNSDNGSLIYEEILNSVATVYNWKDYYLPEIKKVVEVDSAVLNKYAGKYNMGQGNAILKNSDNGLQVNVLGDLYWKVYFTSDTDFFVREFRGSLRFRTDKDKKVTGIVFNGMTAKKIE